MTESVDAIGDEPRKRRGAYGVPSIAVAIFAALIYAYVLWAAIGNLIQLPTLLGSATPWWLLIVDVALPVVAYAAAILLGARHRLAVRAAFFVVGAMVLACCTVGSIAFVHTH